jgi:hypothetical protein
VKTSQLTVSTQVASPCGDDAAAVVNVVNEIGPLVGLRVAVDGVAARVRAEHANATPTADPSATAKRDPRPVCKDCIQLLC